MEGGKGNCNKKSQTQSELKQDEVSLPLSIFQSTWCFLNTYKAKLMPKKGSCYGPGAAEQLLHRDQPPPCQTQTADGVPQAQMSVFHSNSYIILN